MINFQSLHSPFLYQMSKMKLRFWKVLIETFHLMSHIIIFGEKHSPFACMGLRKTMLVIEWNGIHCIHLSTKFLINRSNRFCLVEENYPSVWFLTTPAGSHCAFLDEVLGNLLNAISTIVPKSTCHTIVGKTARV